MLIDSNLISAGLAAGTAVAAGVFAYLRELKRERYLTLWAAGWCLLSLHHVAVDVQSQVQVGSDLWIAETTFLALAALAFFYAAFDYVQKPLGKTAAIVTLAIFSAWIVAYRFQLVPLAPDWGTTALFFA